MSVTTPALSGEVSTDIAQALRYVSDADGNPVSVIVPIDLWREIESERETAYLLRSEPMRRRLLDAIPSADSFVLEETPLTAEKEALLDEAGENGRGRTDPNLRYDREDIYFDR